VSASVRRDHESERTASSAVALRSFRPSQIKTHFAPVAVAVKVNHRHGAMIWVSDRKGPQVPAGAIKSRHARQPVHRPP